MITVSIDATDPDSSSDEAPPAAATSSSSTAPPTTPSKKAAARKRAALRKKNSKLGLTGSTEGTDSDVSLSSVGGIARSLVPPVPSLKVGQQQQQKKQQVEEKVEASGLEDAVEKVKEEVAKVPEAVKKATEEVVPSVPEIKVPQVVLSAETPSASAEPTADDLSDSDAETQPGSYSDDDLSDAEDAPVTSLPAHAPSPPPAKAAPVEAYTGADHEAGKKVRAIITRSIWGIFMIASFIGIVSMGHVYIIALVFIIQAVVFSELSGLFDAGYSSSHPAVGNGGSREREARRRGRREERNRWSRRMSWYFFAATNYFLYGESLIYYFKHILTMQASFLPSTFSFAQHHRLISFGLYVIGFVSFVANLQRAQLRRQFGLFGWIHMSLLLIVVSSHFIVNNILEGLIWFWQPVSLVIMNDIAAYACGMLFGRHQLIKLSPKKTVEGFVGAFFVTIIFAVVWGTYFMRFNYMICPVQDLATNILSDMQCTPNRVFVWRSFPLPESIQSALYSVTGRKFASIPWAPFQLHSIVMAIFASLVAPFGGFFASGFKRAFNIKDFGASIPGHGGMTDRMDCQFLMGLFSYVYYASLIRETHVTVGTVLQLALTSLSTEEQLELLHDLTKLLTNKGVYAATTPY
ncbi:phosphatidate cytidylyltransferase [Pseudohyphozyma bogoriensis]|nr:phosphatidate cytidylyltransferase [Pseudohyphozyma bogoriensis]